MIAWLLNGVELIVENREIAYYNNFSISTMESKVDFCSGVRKRLYMCELVKDPFSGVTASIG